MSNDRIHLFREFSLDLARGCLTKAGEPIHLRPQTYEVLKYLVENQGRLISKDKLIEEVWHGRAVTDGSLGKCIEEVREALGSESRNYVRNVRGRGYIFEGEVKAPTKSHALLDGTEEINFVRMVVEDEDEREEAESAARISIDSSPHPVITQKAGQVRAASITVAILLVLGLMSVIAFLYFANRSSKLSEIESVAVLPFSNEDGDSETEYLSEGISENIINSLSQLSHLKVISRNSSFKYKGKDVEPQEVARALGVQAVLIGRLVQRGDSIVVSVELMDTRDKTQVWGERYVRDKADIQELQETIARTISEKLRAGLSGSQRQQLAKHATDNSQAYQLYLNGIFYYRRGGYENSKKALDYFNQALALDPNFALVWTGVAEVYGAFANNDHSDPKEALARSKAAAQRALELDESLAEAHAALAESKKAEWDWAGAELEFKRAIELNPNLVKAHHWYARYLAPMGRHTEALTEIHRAQELDPLQVNLRRAESMMLCQARRNDEALDKMRQAINLESQDSSANHVVLGMLYEAKGMYGQAIDEYKQAASMAKQTTWNQIILGYALARSGKTSEAQEILRTLKTSREYVSPAELAILYAGLGDKEGALASLEAAYAAHDLQLIYLNVASQYDSLRSDPRFQSLRRRVGLPE